MFFDRSFWMMFVVTVVVSLFLAPAAVAQDPDLEGDLEYVEVENPLELDDGVHANLGVEGSFNLVSNQNMVGQNDGTSLHIGGGVDGNLTYLTGDHILRNTLTYNTSWARTPVLEQFVKNNDRVGLESLYNYYVADWFGPFARFSMETSAFATNSVAAQPVTYEITRADGTVDEETTDALRLADPLRPMSLFESVGVAVEPVRQEAIHASIRLGFGARQTFAAGVLDVGDIDVDDVTPATELSNTFQGGAEAFVGAEGAFPEQRITYRAGATALIPFINNDDTGRSPLQLTRIGFTGTARLAVFDWMGLNYNVTVLNDPQLLDDPQIQNSLLLTFNYTLINTDDDG